MTEEQVNRVRAKMDLCDDVFASLAMDWDCCFRPLYLGLEQKDRRDVMFKMINLIHLDKLDNKLEKLDKLDALVKLDNMKEFQQLVENKLDSIEGRLASMENWGVQPESEEPKSASCSCRREGNGVETDNRPSRGDGSGTNANQQRNNIATRNNLPVRSGTQKSQEFDRKFLQELESKKESNEFSSEYDVAVLSFEETKFALLQIIHQHPEDAVTPLIMWIEENFGPAPHDHSLIRPFMTAICEALIVGPRTFEQLDKCTIKKQFDLLLPYLNSDPNSEAHCLHALSVLMRKLQYPEGTAYGLLCHLKENFTEEGFLKFYLGELEPEESEEETKLKDTFKLRTQFFWDLFIKESLVSMRNSSSKI